MGKLTTSQDHLDADSEEQEDSLDVIAEEDDSDDDNRPRGDDIHDIHPLSGSPHTSLDRGTALGHDEVDNTNANNNKSTDEDSEGEATPERCSPHERYVCVGTVFKVKQLSCVT